MTKIDGNTGTAGLLGYPVKHTKSPMIHNTLAEAYGDNLVYLPFEVEPGALGDAIRGAWALGVLGLNVTVPHKQAVMEYLTRIDPLAKALGAVNTLVREEDGFAGYNTDILGLEQALIRADIGVEGEKVLILGAGGAARAAAFLALKMGAREILIANRSLDKAEDLAQSLMQSAKSCDIIPQKVGRMHAQDGQTDIRAITLTELADGCRGGKDAEYLAFQCTSVGLSPHDTDCVLAGETESIFSMIQTGVDLIYKPAETMFMKKLMSDGKRAINGLDMLLYQGVIAYELWRGSYKGEIETDRQVLDRIRELLRGD
ncbi:MAG: shikimate dehydrogenase [Lachnospiraceae bacterium]|nr:shikimate dehydrogenase [Lachnospiraceae bacterium]